MPTQVMIPLKEGKGEFDIGFKFLFGGEAVFVCFSTLDNNYLL